MNTKKIKNTLYLRLFSWLKIPLIAWLRPTVEVMDTERCVVRIPLSRRSRNHLNSMYFGVLCVGADCAGGLIAMDQIQQRKAPVSFVFKDFKANFRRRAEGDVFFTCEDGVLLRELVQRALDEKARVEDKVSVVATVPSKLGTTPVAEFELTISLKARS